MGFSFRRSRGTCRLRARKIGSVEHGRMVIQGLSGLSNGPTRIRAFELWLQQNGGELLRADNAVPALNSERGLQALTALKGKKLAILRNTKLGSPLMSGFPPEKLWPWKMVT